MRELKDYFCTFRQGVKLINLGFDISNQLHIKHENLRTVILRSQALDFFRDKGYVILPKRKDDWDWMEIITPNSGVKRIYTMIGYSDLENKCIDKLIELETEAQHGKN